MDDEKCSKDCASCNLNEKLIEIVEKAIKDKRPVLLLAEVSDEMSTILLHGDQSKVAHMLYSAIDNDERLEELFLRVMSIKSREMLKEVLGGDVISEIKDKMKAHHMSNPQSKPKAEC